MQAIITKYLPATDTRGSRIKATCERGSITIDYPHHLSGDDVHIAAADALIAKFVKEDAERYGEKFNPWSAPRVCGAFHGGMAHVFLEPDMYLEVPSTEMPLPKGWMKTVFPVKAA